MAEGKGLTRYVWPIIVVLSLVLMGMSLLPEMSIIETIRYSLESAGSAMTLESLDEGAVACFSMYTSRTFMTGIWFGVFGLFAAWGIKRRERFAWKLGVLWSVVLTAHGTIGSVAEVLYWWVHKPSVCPLFLLSIIAGVIALGCLIVVRKEVA